MAAQDIERAVLGAVLLNPAHWPQIAVLRPDEFLLDSHRKIFSCMLNLAESSRPIEILTVAHELDRRKELEAIGDVGYLSSLVDGLPDRPLQSVKHYVDEVCEGAGRRCIVVAAESIREKAANDPAATIANLRRRFLDAERAVARYEAGHVTRITRTEDIPCPFACPSDETRWVVQGLVPARGITVIAGEAGAGKTWLALALARATTFRDDFLGRRTTNAQVLYLDRENPLSLVRDRLRVLFGGPSEFRPWGLWCQDEPPTIGDPRLLEFARKGPVLIIDSMIRFHRADENSATEMAPVMAFLRELATVGASVVVLHHKSKSETSSYRGSTDILAGADTAFALSRRDGNLELRTIKNRFAADTTIKIQADFTAGTFTVEGTPGLECAAELDRLTDIIQSSPGLTQNDVIKQSGMKRERAIDLLRGHKGRLWRQEGGTNRSLRYHAIQAVPKDARRESIGNQLPGGSHLGFAADSNWREPLGITQVVPVPPPLRGGNLELVGYHGA